MYLSHLAIDHFRNYPQVSIDLPEKGALFSGLNGSGKTNLLEAIYFLCTARSQRNASRDAMISFDSDFSYIEGTFKQKTDAVQKTNSIGFSRDKKVSMKAGGAVISSFSKWIGHCTVISFGPDDIMLVRGLPKERRMFIDLCISQIDSRYLESLINYKKNCAQRNILLSSNINDLQLDLYERNMARWGAFIFFKRQEILSFMKPYFSQFYSEICGSGESGSIEYRPSIRCDNNTLADWENVFYTGLKSTRKTDIQYGFTSIGPHRDDILLSLNGKGAKSFASQGQCSTLTLSLRMCSIICSEQYKQDTLIFLFDDALTYLDHKRTLQVFPLIEKKGQIFFTTSSSIAPFIADIPRFNIENGRVSSA